MNFSAVFLQQRWKRFLILAVPAGAFLFLSHHLHSVTLGLLSIPGVWAAAALAVAFGRLPRRPPEEGRRDAWHAPIWVFLAGAPLTAFFWIRVWAHRDWEMLGIPVLFAQIFGFWWLAVLYAMIVWFLEEKLLFPGGRRRYWWRLGGGLLGAIAGVSLYSPASAWYFRHFDREPLRFAVKRLESALPPVLYPEPIQEIPSPPVPGARGLGTLRAQFTIPTFRMEKAKLRWRRRGKRLFLAADLGEWKKVTAQRSLRTDPFREGQIPYFLERAKELVDRKDIREIAVELKVGGGETLKFQYRETP